jgi:hypothetical protein
MEVLGYLLLSPFPAVRRLLSLVVVLTLLTVRLAVPACAAGRRRRWLDWIVALGVILGLTYAAIDFREAQAEHEGAQRAAEWIREHGGGRTWFLGHWGFQYAAERLGMQAVIFSAAEEPGAMDLPPPSELRQGDWLIVPDSLRVHGPELDWDHIPLRQEGQVVLEDHLPLRTCFCFYDGGVPVEPHPHPRLVVRIYRVVVDFRPWPVYED